MAEVTCRNKTSSTKLLKYAENQTKMHVLQSKFNGLICSYSRVVSSESLYNIFSMYLSGASFNVVLYVCGFFFKTHSKKTNGKYYHFIH